MLPNFLGLGAQRCATTWLYECLKEHPNIYMPKTKEIGYFNKHYEKGLEWYRRFFKDQDGEFRRGEITPEYLFYPEIPKRIVETLGPIRLFMVLRNPIDRAYSSYCLRYREGLFQASFHEFLEQNYDHVIDRGFYDEQLERYLDVFDEDAILVLIYEDMATDPHSFMSQLFSFLGVETDVTLRKLKHRYNIGVSERPITVRALKAIRDQIHQFPPTRDLVKGMQRWSVGNRLIQQAFAAQKSDIPTDAEAMLRERYRQSVDNLSQYLGRDLTREWLST